jgi:iron complex outermembrane receptor protein
MPSLRSHCLAGLAVDAPPPRRVRLPGRLRLRALTLLPCLSLAPCAVAVAQALPEVTVSANPLNPDEPRSVQPASVLRGTDLERRRETSLGATLSREPGVHDSGYGTAAGRPVIRGLDGPRVGVAQGGLDALDVSALSPDHAVSVDPLSARSVEILRGPATLLYGGGAIGGLVNVVTDRIPTTRLTGLRGEALGSGDTASRGWSGALGLRAGAAGLNWTANAFGRGAGDYAIPGNAVVGDPGSASGRLPNSFARGDGASAGVSWVGSRGVVGAAVSELSNRYGIPAEEDVYIKLRQTRTEVLGELDGPLPGFAQLRARYAENRYRHDEVEGASGEVGTAFRNEGRDGRLELLHQPVGGVRGALGLQSRSRDLSTSGEEAYLPSTRDRMNAVFYVGEVAIGAGRLEFGWRNEHTRLTPDDASGAPARSFAGNTFSLGGTAPLAPGWAIAASVAASQRAPVAEELYANGPHAATATWEIGNPDLGRERSTNFELALRRTEGPVRGRVGVYANRFSNYVYGRYTDDNGDGVADRVDEDNAIVNGPDDPDAGDFKRLVYSQSGARFAGIEAELAWRPAGSPWSLRALADLARGRIDGAGDAPRMSPTRVGASADYLSGPWSGFVSLLSVQRQSRLAPLETGTAGYLRLDAEIAWTVRQGEQRAATFFVQGRNLLNEEIRLHTSYIKDVAPQPGRSLLAGVRARF